MRALAAVASEMMVVAVLLYLTPPHHNDDDECKMTGYYAKSLSPFYRLCAWFFFLLFIFFFFAFSFSLPLSYSLFYFSVNICVWRVLELLLSGCWFAVWYIDDGAEAEANAESERFNFESPGASSCYVRS